MTNLKILQRFTVVTVITVAAVAALLQILSSVFGYDAGAGVGIVSVIVPSLDAGSNYAKKVGKALAKGRMWRLSGIFILINAGLGVLITVALVAFAGISVTELLAALDATTVLYVLAFVLALYWLVGRLFLGFGAKKELKRQEKLRG